jgi:Family of unknown function (DUF6011)
MTTKAQINDAARIPVLVLAGNSTFTLVSKKTGTRFTYQVSQCDDKDNGGKKELWFVSTMTGPDNNSNFAYTGIITRANSGMYSFRRTAKSRISDMAPSYKAINWFLSNALAPTFARANTNNALSQVEFWHEGTCARCGRKLTVPESIASGLGPECAGKTGGFAAEAAPAWRSPREEAAIVNAPPRKLAGHATATGWSAKPLPKAKAKLAVVSNFKDDSLDGLFGT